MSQWALNRLIDIHNAPIAPTRTESGDERVDLRARTSRRAAARAPETRLSTQRGTRASSYLLLYLNFLFPSLCSAPLLSLYSVCACAALPFIVCVCVCVRACVRSCVCLCVNNTRRLPPSTLFPDECASIMRTSSAPAGGSGDALAGHNMEWQAQADAAQSITGRSTSTVLQYE